LLAVVPAGGYHHQRSARFGKRAERHSTPAGAQRLEQAMTAGHDESAQREQRLHEILYAYLQAVDAGYAPDHRQILRRHPELAKELAAFFADKEKLNGLAQLMRRMTSEASAALDQSGAIVPTLPPRASECGDIPADLPRFVGDYEILHELGRGGMGVVYKARHTWLDRIVALKMILAGGYAGEQERDRFHTETQAIARLQHPYIVQIYEVGEIDGKPYCALEFCAGGSLANRLHGTPLPPREAAVLVAKLASAMGAAHRAGIVHRDLKPANILLASTGDGPSSVAPEPDVSATGDRAPPTEYAQPKITDFGLAKRLDATTGQTASGAIVGTPSYMAPEQAGGRIKEVGPLADVYALGAILYELLTGRPPFKAAMAVDTLLQVLSEDPVPPSRLQPKVPRDLETICLKCLQKEPAKRYASAAAFGKDVRRYLDGKPVLARPTRLWERGLKWAARRPALAALLVVSVLAVVGLLGGGYGLLSGGPWRNTQLDAALQDAARQRDEVQKARTDALGQRNEAYQARAEAARQRDEADRARAEAARQRATARRHGYAAQLLLVQREWDDAHVGRVVEHLAAQPPKLPGDADLRGFEWYYWWRRCHTDLLTLRGDTPGSHGVVFSPDGQRLASTVGPAPAGRGTRGVTIRDATTGREILSLKGHPGAIHALAFSPDGERLATAGADRAVKVWDAHTGGELLTLEGHAGAVLGVAFSSDGRRLASTGADGTVKLWDAAKGEVIRTLEGHAGAVHGVAFHPKDQRLASAGADGTVRVWDAAKGQEIGTLQGHTGAVYAVAFHPNGQRLASAGADQTIKVWDAVKGEEVGTLRGHAGAVNAVAFRPDGRRLASASDDQTVKVWDVARGQEVLTLKGHTDAVTAVAFRADGQRLASASADRTAKVWDADKGQEIPALQGHAGAVSGLAFRADGQRLATAGADQTVKLWDVAKGQVVRSKGHAGGVHGVAFRADGLRLASAGADQSVKVWDAGTGEEVVTLQGHTGAVTAVAFSPDGLRLASASTDRSVRLWDAITGQPLLTLKGHGGAVTGVAFSPDGLRLASASADQTVKVWDARTGQDLLTLQGHTGAVTGVAFSPDGLRLASGSADKSVKVWDAGTGQELLSLQGHTARVNGVCFSPDGRRLASAGADRTAKIWDTATGQEVLTLKGHAGGVMAVAFSGDGQRLASAGGDGAVKIWDAPRPAP
jgi:WD40 repeat protein/serine/threonine protein kinase